jgi:surface antigen
MVLVLGTLLFASAPVLSNAANASTEVDKHLNSGAGHQQPISHSDAKHPLSKSGKARYAGSGGLQCVPFARAASGIALKGNAANWWDAASGVYERGNRPETGSVLNFRATGGMRLGHVAVVTNVLGSREVEIDHANWSLFGATKGNVSRGMKVMDVSDANDWSLVRVELGHTEEFGREYPTYGFIYDRPDRGRMVANSQDDAALPASSRPVLGFDEVAEAPAGHVLSPAALAVDAPDHSFR